MLPSLSLSLSVCLRLLSEAGARATAVLCIYSFVARCCHTGCRRHCLPHPHRRRRPHRHHPRRRRRRPPHRHRRRRRCAIIPLYIIQPALCRHNYRHNPFHRGTTKPRLCALSIINAPFISVVII